MSMITAKKQESESEISYYVVEESAKINLPSEVELYDIDDQNLLQMYLRQFDDSIRVSAIVDTGEVIYGIVYRGNYRSARNWDKVKFIRETRKGKTLRRK